MGQYTVAPAFAGLQPLYKKIAFTMALPTIIGKTTVLKDLAIIFETLGSNRFFLY
jgi:hypothetical protein